MGTLAQLLKQSETNPEAKSALEKLLGRLLPAGKGSIELPGNTGLIEKNLADHPYSVPPPERPMLGEGRGDSTPIPLSGNVGVEETGAMGGGTPSQELPMLNAGKGNSTPIELPAAQLEETGAMGQGTPGDSAEAAITSLPPSEQISQTPQAGPNPSLEQFGAESPFEREPMTSEMPTSEKPGMSLGKKAAIGAAGLGAGLGAYEMTQADAPPPAPALPPESRNPAVAEQTKANDLNLMANINGRGGPAPHKTGSGPSITPDVTDKHLQDALNFGSGEEQAAALQEVKNRQTMAELGSGLGRAGSIIGSAMAKVPENKEAAALFTDNQKQAENIVPNYLANQENDPKSQQSLALRNVLDKLGVKYTGQPSATQLKQALPYIFKDQEAKQAQQSRSDDNKYRWAEMRQRGVLAAQAHADARASADEAKRQQQDFMKEKFVGAALDQTKGNKAIQNDMETLRRVANAKDILDQFPNKNEIPTDKLNMINTDIATIMAGGVAGEGLIHEVSTPTVRSNMSKSWAKYMNHPTGAGAAEFLTQNQTLLQNLSDSAQDRLYAKYRKTMNTLGQNLSPNAQERYRGEYLPDDVRGDNGLYMRHPHGKKPQTQNGGDSSQQDLPPGTGGPAAPSWAIK